MEWDFGDGTTSTEQNPDHVYTIAGSYTVQLTVSGPGGAAGVAKSDLIAVQPGPPVSLEVSPSSAALAVEERKQFTAVAKDEFGNVVPSALTWAIAGEGGSITDRGLFTADTMAGTFADTVIASSEADAEELVATASIRVEPGPVASVVLEPAEVTLEIEDTQPFQVEVLDEFGNRIPDALISWESLAESGTIDANGQFTAGTTAGSFPDAVKVDVVKGTSRASASADISVDPNPLAIVEVHPSDVVLDTGISQQFAASGSDEYGNEIPELAFIWRATGGNITQDGQFTAGGRPGSYEVRVSATFGTSIRSESANVQVFSWSWWPGDGDANDAAGNNHGTLKNGATFARGVIGQAFSFDGRDDFVAFPSRGADLIAPQFTIEFWANPGAVPDRPTFGFSESSNRNAQNPIASYDKALTIGGGLNGSDPPEMFQLLERLPDAAANTWTYYAVVGDGANYIIYVNGVSRPGVAIVIDPARETDRTFVIGQSGFESGFADYFKGKIDEFAIRSRSLSAEEIKARYEAGSSGS